MGAVAVSAHQIVSNITSTLYMVPLSIGIAASVLVSQCLGAGFPMPLSGLRAGLSL